MKKSLLLKLSFRFLELFLLVGAFFVGMVATGATSESFSFLNKAWLYESKYPELTYYSEFQFLLAHKEQNPNLKIFSENGLSEAGKNTLLPRSVMSPSLFPAEAFAPDFGKDGKTLLDLEKEAPVSEKPVSEEAEIITNETDSCATLTTQITAAQKDQSPTKISGQENFRAEVMCLINAEREKAGLEALKWNAALQVLTEEHSEDMAENLKALAHTSSEGNDIAARALDGGYNYSLVGENVAMGATSAKQVVSLWMNSQGHRANILNPEFQESAVGLYNNAQGEIYWTQIFGTQLGE